MKNKFSCFYHPAENTELKSIWKDPQTIFIFDTNVLLSLYSFQPEGRKDFFKVLTTIENRIWIPFHVGLEFQKNRLSVIKKRRNTFNDLNKDIDKLIDTLKFDKKPFTTISNVFSLKKNYQPVQEKLDLTFSEINKLFKELDSTLRFHLQEIKDEVKALDKDRVFINSDDFIRKEIDKLFNEEKVGTNTFNTQEKLDHLYKEGEQRYANGIPPGYKDISKGEDEFFFDGLHYKSKFGDLIIFKQIIEFSKEKNIKNIVFISEDIKEDWRSIEEFEGTKILGARSELKRELYTEASVENFLIYQIEEFMQKTNDYLDIKIESGALKSIKLSLEEEKRMYEEHLRIQRMHEDQIKAQELLKRHITAQEIFGEQLKNQKLLKEHLKAQEIFGEQLKNQELLNEHLKAQEIFGEQLKNQETLNERLKIQELLKRHFTVPEIFGEQLKNQELLKEHLKTQQILEDQLKNKELWKSHLKAQSLHDTQLFNQEDFEDE